MSLERENVLSGVVTGMGADIASFELVIGNGETEEEIRISLRAPLQDWANGLVRTLDKVNPNEIIGAMVVSTTSAALDRTAGTTIFSADGTYRAGKVEEMNSDGRVAAHNRLLDLQTWAKEQSWTKHLLSFAKRQRILLSSSLFELDEQFRVCKNARLVNILNHCFLARNWLPFSNERYSFGSIGFLHERLKTR